MNPTDEKMLHTMVMPDQLFDYGALAYVKPITTERGQGFAVCAADGTQLAVFNNQEVAIFAARQHDLDPVLIH